MKTSLLLLALLTVSSPFAQAAPTGKVQFKTAHAIFVESPATVYDDENIKTLQAEVTGPIAQELLEMLVLLKRGVRQGNAWNVYQYTCKVHEDGSCAKLVPLISCTANVCDLRDAALNEEDNADLVYQNEKSMGIGLNGFAIEAILQKMPGHFKYIKVAGPRNGGGSEGSGFAAPYIDLSND